ncbi:hypothetical protein HHK36_031001 [Tetracentron sinense]|uniref:Syntaxin 6/10/61 N-terminal domain-containing protein n=1 Tax=Tetracentron sinense TaxID=13715 RepID=A0A834YDT0_TETSI|nr:hypothetical protein HHK36_031001 [Tetracentron sinense]
MASNFDRWEKDPFFAAAEEVQESADRMESGYRRWIHELKDASSIYDSVVLRRDLRTAVGTAKWQLEEFERAVRSSYGSSSADDDRERHYQFIGAIESQISTVENSLQESVLAEGRTSLPWVRLDEGECDELALFLTGSLADGDRIPLNVPGKDEAKNPEETHGEAMPDCSKNACHSAELGVKETGEERLHGHRRTASASADIGAWKITVADHDFDGRPDHLPPPKVQSFSVLLRAMDKTSSNLKWPKNGFRKWKGVDRNQKADTEPLQSHQLSRGIDACYERSKSCLDSCDDSYDKQIYGWFGAIHRQLQRSQYQIQYGRPLQVTFWVILVLCLIVLFLLRAI